jgi:hypothetical protein
MKHSKFWNALVLAVAAVLFLICLPSIVTLFIAKTAEVTCTWFIDLVADNKLSQKLVDNRDTAIKLENTKVVKEDD